jgi:succinyl-CoA synthetase alpha subunit
MSILVEAEAGVLVQGITGRDGAFHTARMLEFGTRVVGGVTPGKGGQEVSGLPVFNTVCEAVQATGATVSVVYVPADHAKAALLEAADSALELVVCITEGIPTLDVLEAVAAFKARGKRLVGPNCPGLLSPGRTKVGIMPSSVARPGRVGVLSRSGTLTYEIANALSQAGIGQSTCVGVGGDPIIGSRFIDLLPLFEADRDTECVVLIGEIGGQDEILAAEYWKAQMKKPLVAFISGLTAPPGRRMGHAGALVGSANETAAAKIEKLKALGVPVARFVRDVPGLVQALDAARERALTPEQVASWQR